MLLNAEQIFAADDLTHEDVPVPEWGGDVRVSKMSGADRDELEHWSLTQGKCDADGHVKDQRGFRAIALAVACRDEAGERLFAVADLERLSKKNADVIDRLWDVCARLNKLGGKAAEETEKNSDAAPSGDSGTS